MSHRLAWAIVASCAACGSHRSPESAAGEMRVYHPPPVITPEAQLQVDGPEVASALDAVGQTPLPARVAVFARDEELAQQLASALPGLQGVADVYVIPGYLVDGESRWQPPYYSVYRQPAPLDLQRLRELAAMAHCDVMLVVDHGFRERVYPNAWVALSPLLAPALFAPMMRVLDQSYLDASMFDVRNGFLYGQISAEQHEERGPITIYALELPSVRAAQLEALVDDARAQISDLLWHHLLQPVSVSSPTPAGPATGSVQTPAR